jgi:phosphoenolpyruvate phosphomutase
MKKTTRLKKLITSQQTEFILEAHNGLSSKIVEEAGFKGVWASGLTISASLGLRDNNEASWTQVLDVIEYMSDATSLPILLDGDTGFGNFNNMRRLVKKLEQRDVGGVCIEDKIYPKTNSFIGGEKQPLADIKEFCGRIKAGKDTQIDGDFCIVARVEAFIAGWGLDEALKRAHAYAEAGADAIFIHSKLHDPKDIFAFMENWDNSKPVVIVPTMYFKTPTEEFENAGISLVIWANHLLRSSVRAMQETARQVYKDQSLMDIENKIVPVSEIFRIQNVEEYKQAETKYLPQSRNIRGIILAASKGENFGSLTDDKPKCMIEIQGKTILQTQVETFNNCRIKDILVVVGYRKEAIDLPGIKKIENMEYENRNILYSYYSAMDAITGPCVISFGDILFEPHILQGLLGTDGDVVLAVDTSWWQGKKRDREIDMVICEKPPADDYLSERCTYVKEIGTNLDRERAHGEWTGLLKLSTDGARLFRDELERLFSEDKEKLYSMDINEFIKGLVNTGCEVKAYYFRGHWLDIDSEEDLSLVQDI